MNHVKCQLVLLSVTKAQKGCLMQPYDQKSLSIASTEIAANNHNNGVVDIKPKQLYVVSDEPISVGDYYFNPANLKATIERGPTWGGTIISLCEYDHEAKSCNDKNLSPVFKVVATTDESLGLPRPSNSFLKVYGTVFNKMHNVLVETETVLTDPDLSDEVTRERIKVAPDNTITIRPFVEKTYTKEEVIKLIQGAWKGGYDMGAYRAVPRHNQMKEQPIMLKDFIIENELL